MDVSRTSFTGAHAVKEHKDWRTFNHKHVCSPNGSYRDYHGYHKHFSRAHADDFPSFFFSWLKQIEWSCEWEKFHGLQKSSNHKGIWLKGDTILVKALGDTLAQPSGPDCWRSPDSSTWKCSQILETLPVSDDTDDPRIRRCPNTTRLLCGVCNKNARGSQATVWCDSYDIGSHRTCVGLTLHKQTPWKKSWKLILLPLFTVATNGLFLREHPLGTRNLVLLTHLRMPLPNTKWQWEIMSAFSPRVSSPA